MNNPNINKNKRNMQENENLIAEGFLSLMQKEWGKAAIRSADVSREVGINRCVVERHLSDGRFFERNNQRITDEFKKRTSGISNASNFAFVFLSCVQQHQTWFKIEFVEGRYRLYKEIMVALEAQITGTWALMPDSQRMIFYRLYCGEVFNLLSEWYEQDAFRTIGEHIESRLSRLSTAFATGILNKIMATILYPTA